MTDPAEAGAAHAGSVALRRAVSPGPIGLDPRGNPEVAPASLVIAVTPGTGTGPTKLAAFDAALRTAGVANVNLLPLSSVIPPGSVVVTTARADVEGRWGDRLYVVMAQARVDTPNGEAWAGVGWAQEETGRGLFVEHEGHSEASVRRDIADSMASLVGGRGIDLGPTQMVVEARSASTSQPARWSSRSTAPRVGAAEFMQRPDTDAPLAAAPSKATTSSRGHVTGVWVFTWYSLCS